MPNWSPASPDQWVMRTKRGYPSRPKQPKPKKKAKPKAARPISPQVRAALEDRLEAAAQAGLIDVMEDEGHTDSLAITTGEFALLLVILFPEDYLGPTSKRKPKPTSTAPGSEERLVEYARRAERSQALYAAGDARADTTHGKGLRIEQRRNGSGVRVLGWEDDEEE